LKVQLLASPREPITSAAWQSSKSARLMAGFYVSATEGDWMSRALARLV
jgi:hypothetical protein